MNQVPIEISARHVHISKADLEEIYGSGYKLKPIKDLSQKGQFACEEKVDLKTTKGIIKGVRILGPERELTQVEITKTEAYQLGINPPIAECTSCAGKEAAEITIVGLKAEINRHAAIIAHRHIHCSPKNAESQNWHEGDLISIRVEGDRPVTFHQILIRIDESFDFQLHLDTDEANACALNIKTPGIIIKD